MNSTRDKAERLAAVPCSPLETRGGSTMVLGRLWKDVTSYSQGSKKPPSVWETRIGELRILVSHECGQWTAWSYGPTTAEFTWRGLHGPEHAAKLAMFSVTAWLRTAADLIVANTQPSQIDK